MNARILFQCSLTIYWSVIDYTIITQMSHYTQFHTLQSPCNLSIIPSNLYTLIYEFHFVLFIFLPSQLPFLLSDGIISTHMI
jgi:hypothetical protein